MPVCVGCCFLYFARSLQLGSCVLCALSPYFLSEPWLCSEVEIRDGSRLVGTLRDGSSFGSLGLIMDRPRASSAVAKTDVCDREMEWKRSFCLWGFSEISLIPASSIDPDFDYR